MQFIPINHIKKVLSKNIENQLFQSQIRVKNGTRAHIWAYTFWPATGAFFDQFQKKLYSVTQETESFQMSPYLHGLGLNLRSTPGDAHIWKWAWLGTRWTWRFRNPTKSLVYGYGFLVNSYLENEFSKKKRLNPPLNYFLKFLIVQKMINFRKIIKNQQKEQKLCLINR